MVIPRFTFDPPSPVSVRACVYMCVCVCVRVCVSLSLPPSLSLLTKVSGTVLNNCNSLKLHPCDPSLGFRRLYFHAKSVPLNIITVIRIAHLLTLQMPRLHQRALGLPHGARHQGPTVLQDARV